MAVYKAPESMDDSLVAFQHRVEQHPMQLPDSKSKEVHLKLVVAMPTGQDGFPSNRVVELPALTDDTILSIKLRLRNKGCFTDSHYLFFGERQLLEHETIGQLMASTPGNPKDYLHIFAYMSDIEAFCVKSLKTSYSLNKLSDNMEGTSPAKSALTRSLLLAADDETDSRIVRASSFPDMASPKISSSQTIVHLMFKKTAKAEYHINNSTYEITISAEDTPEDVIRRIETTSAVSLSEDHDLVYMGQVLQKGKPLASYGLGQGSVLEIVPVEPQDAVRFPDGSPLLSDPEHKLYENWQRARQGLACGAAPKLASIGAGGSYFLQDCDGHNVAVFKPRDEEPKAVNNPKGLSTSPDGEGLRKGTRPGEGALREVAAYLLDHEHYAGVPPTAMVTCSVSGSEHGTKVGSLQQFVQADSDCEERGTSFFPVHEVHKIAILDIRLANTDRNGGNILVKEHAGGWKLIPIDHGYCLPESFEDITFEWLYWPQAAKPFSETDLEYISRLDSERDMSILAAHDIHLRPQSQRVLRVCTMLLKKAAALGLTAFQIGMFMSREYDRLAPLERLHAQAEQWVQSSLTCEQDNSSSSSGGGCSAAPITPASSDASTTVDIDCIVDDVSHASLQDQYAVVPAICALKPLPRPQSLSEVSDVFTPRSCEQSRMSREELYLRFMSHLLDESLAEYSFSDSQP